MFSRFKSLAKPGRGYIKKSTIIWGAAGLGGSAIVLKLLYPRLADKWLFKDPDINTPKRKEESPIEKTVNIREKRSAIYYELDNPSELRAIEISSDLSSAKFYFAKAQTIAGQDDYEREQAENRIKGLVSGAVYPHLPEMGYVMVNKEFTQIFGMSDYLSMAKCSKKHIKSSFCIAEQLHPLEWILTKARNSGILSNQDYEKIRIDVRHRALQIQKTTKENHAIFKEVYEGISKNYLPDMNFKPIKSASDIEEFRGKIIAYQSDSYYFSKEENAITLPCKTSESIRFAQVGNSIFRWQGGEYGYLMDCFISLKAVGSTQALINSRIEKDSMLAMRPATVTELNYLKLALELNEGRLEYGDRKKNIKMLEDKIAETSLGANFQTRASFSIFSFFPKSAKAVTPAFEHFEGKVDWNREKESQDKIVPPKPSRVIIKDGDEALRSKKLSLLLREEAIPMYASYYNKDKSECALVFACDHDTFNQMNFETAKKLNDDEAKRNFARV